MRGMAIVCASFALCAQLEAQQIDRSTFSGDQLYQAACATCHGTDGRGRTLSASGASITPPDFTECTVTTPEADADWHTVIHRGGPARAFDRLMPAFGDELTDTEITKVIARLREFCTQRDWPHGDLNLPRAFVTEKAYPENEAVVTTSIARGEGRAVRSEFLFERRVGRRGQYELFAVDVEEAGIAYKHVVAHDLRRGFILAGGGEVKVSDAGAVVEAFGSVSQILPFIANGFLHAQAGVEAPTEASASNEVFWRSAVGKTFASHGWGRAWSPMVELLAARPLDPHAHTEWDLLPQVQVSLSTRQHVLVNAGVRLPLTDRTTRRTAALVYLLWDWFDGGFLDGW